MAQINAQPPVAAPTQPARAPSNAVAANGAVFPTRTFSPQRPLIAADAAAGAAQVESAAAAKPIETVTVKLPPAPVPAQRPAAAADPQKKLASSKPSDASAKDELVRDLQRELKRVGCYDGDVDGSWGGSSKRAMSAFTDRVNATLPVDEPDYILLTLVQGHPQQACGKPCPSGQTISSEGRCVANSVMAAKPRAPKSADRNDARIADAKIQQERRSSESRSTGVSSWSTTIAQAPQEPATPLPGRMAIGAARPGDVAEADPRRGAPNAPRLASVTPAAPTASDVQVLDGQARLDQEIAARRAAEARQQEGIGAGEQRAAVAAAAAASGAAAAAVVGNDQATRRAAPERTRRYYEQAPVAVYRAPPPPRYIPPPTYNVGRFQGAPATSYNPGSRNWKQTVLSDMARNSR